MRVCRTCLDINIPANMLTFPRLRIKKEGQVFSGYERQGR